MSGTESCGLLRRLAAIIYDCLLIFPLLMLATAIVLPFASGDAFSSNNPLYSLYLILVCYIYFTWQWVHGGQTLGMRAWKIRLVSFELDQVSCLQASLRFLLSILSWLIGAIGYLWSVYDQDNYAFHDHFSKTRLIVKQ